MIVRRLSVINTGRKPRSLDEQLKKIKSAQEKLDAAQNHETDHQPNSPSRPATGQGTMTLAQRLSQTLRDPLRAPDFAGVVSRGDIEVDCHSCCKVVSIKNRAGSITVENIRNLTDVMQIIDTNWYDRWALMTGGHDNFLMGVDLRTLVGPAGGPHAGPGTGK
eukprot:CAMPEP_0113665022 /NCGR_PEP_ID=MMETSP0038_2-20120614/2064_1 /TAXON_ID=2898 /ORGANISM="Cryptomonas paramecium" /LENGTH=162 /DNA_ID=CAMNT_0000580309 /DNA_START=130 /DNA_END=615 /DNA_ORIENTATION=- /assembly_acc=CAM_ASM_000170